MGNFPTYALSASFTRLSLSCSQLFAFVWSSVWHGLDTQDTFFFGWGPCRTACGILAPQQGTNLRPPHPQWKWEVLTTEPPGKSLNIPFRMNEWAPPYQTIYLAWVATEPAYLSISLDQTQTCPQIPVYLLKQVNANVLCTIYLLSIM